MYTKSAYILKHSTLRWRKRHRMFQIIFGFGYAVSNHIERFYKKYYNVYTGFWSRPNYDIFTSESNVNRVCLTGDDRSGDDHRRNDEILFICNKFV